ncbi:MAG: choice-of-anchor D domain-containing protein, partial [Ignavibacteriales bacterium]|nr:choice-of-anchor D domain-containing protein [Ignavibacteriales bacterium]
GDFKHLNLNPTVLNSASLTGTPIGIATDASGHTIVLTSEGSVFSLTTTGTVLASVTLPGTGTPVAITMNNVGDIYVVKGNGTVFRLNTSLVVLATQTVTGTPVDITVDVPSSVYIITSTGTIHKRTQNLGTLTTGTVTGTPTSIFANTVGDIFVTTSGGTVHRLNNSLTTLASGSVPGTPIDVSADDAGNTIVATSGGQLHKITNAITVLASTTLTGTLVGVDLDDAGHVVTANTAGTVFVENTSLTFETHVDCGVALRTVAVNWVGDIFAVGGTGTPTTVAGASFSVTSLDFAVVTAGTSATRTFVVSSTGTASLSITSDAITTSAPAGVWNINPVIPPTVTLTTPSTRTFTVTFSPPAGITSDVNYTGTVTLATNDPSHATQAIALAGTGHRPVPRACYTGTALPFGSVNTGTNTTRTFTVRNCGDAPLHIQTVTLNTTNPAGIWNVSPAVPPVITLAPGNTQTFTVRLTVPAGLTSDVTYNATISVQTDDPTNSVETITAGGTGHVPFARIQIPSEYFDIDYREVELGYHFSRPLLVRNTGDLALTFQVVYVDPSDPDRPHFALETDAQNFSIPAGQERIFRQTFQPTDVGTKNLVLQIRNSNDATFTTQNITLHGIGTPPIPIDAALVLDRSGSMSESAGEIIKIEALRRSATLFTELLRDGVDYLGITKYDDQNSNILNLGEISAVRANAQTLLSQTSDPNGIAPRGTTGIGGAMRTASGQYALSPSPTTHKPVMVVLTDGMENEEPWIRQVINGYGSYPGLFAEHPNLLTYSVGLGSSGNVNATRLQEITNRGARGFFTVTGNLQGLDIFNLENFYFKVFADAIGHSLVIDPTFNVGLGQTLEVPIGVITDDREAIFFFIGELPEQAYIFELVDPKNHVMSSTGTIGGMSVQIKQMNNWSVFRVKFPPADINTDYVGIWKFRVHIDNPAQWVDTTRSPKYVAGTHASSHFGQGGIHRMSFAASVGSNYKLATSLSPGIVLTGQTIHMRAALTEAGWPSPRGHISVTTTRPNGTVDSQNLFDDGAHGDDAAGDGIFGGDYTKAAVDGVYKFMFTSNGTTERGESVTRQAVKSQYVGAPTDDPKSKPCISCFWIRTIIAIIILLLIAIILLLRRRSAR